MPSNEYQVKTGDTLAAIARRYSVGVDVLARYNGISDVNRIYVGQVLKIPEARTGQQPVSTQPQTYRVRAGETLAVIATDLGLSVEELCKANGITESTTLVVGQVLNLPQKTPAPEKKTAQEQPKKSSAPQESAPSTNDVMAVAFRITGAIEGGQAKSFQNQDGGIVSYGKHQATLASGTLGTILQKYVDQSSSVAAKQLSSYMSRVNKKDPALRDDAGFKKLLLAAADEPLMGTIQDAVFAETYWPPAEQGAKSDKLQSALALAMYYDTNIQGGLSAVREATAAAMAGKEFSEAAWLKEFNHQRDERLKRLAQDRRKAAKDKKTTADKKKKLEQEATWIEASRSRVGELQRLVDAGDLQLQGDKDGKLLINGKKIDGLRAGSPKSGGKPTTPPARNPAVAKVVKPPVTSKPSANFSSRGSTDIDAIILHHTASNNAEQDLVQLTRKGTGVSSHYLIAPDGTIYQLVDDSKRAWHAGESAIRGEKTPDVNSRSIGIEITNDGRGTTPFTEAQYQSLEQLVPYLAVTYEVPSENILGHRDVAPRRKTDPADNFEWSRVRAAVDAARGASSEQSTPPSKPVTPSPAPKKGVPVSKSFDATLKDWITLHEDRRYEVYSDTQQHPTVGIGFNLDREGASQRMQALGINYKGVRAGTVKLTDTQIDTLYEQDVKGALETARSVLGKDTYEALNEARKIVVLDMIFNLGPAGFAKFKKMIQAVQRADFEGAAREMQDSLWYGQTGRRSKHDVASMRLGVLSAEGSGKTGGTTPTKKPVTEPGKSTPPPPGGGGKSTSPANNVALLKDIARNVHDAMHDGLGTDEEKVYANLARLNHDATLINQFKVLYKATYQVDVVEDIESDFSNTALFGAELDRALSYLVPRKSQQAPAAPKKATPSSPDGIIIRYGENAVQASVTAYSLGVLKDILKAAKLTSATISSTSRDPANQARVMYDNLEDVGVTAQKNLYGPAGDKVIDVYAREKRAGSTPEKIKKAMVDKINELGPTKVSHHASDPKVLNVFDVSPRSIANAAAFKKAVKADKRVSKFLEPPSDPGFHLEIPQP